MTQNSVYNGMLRDCFVSVVIQFCGLYHTIERTDGHNCSFEAAVAVSAETFHETARTRDTEGVERK